MKYIVHCTSGNINIYVSPSEDSKRIYGKHEYKNGGY